MQSHLPLLCRNLLFAMLTKLRAISFKTLFCMSLDIQVSFRQLSHSQIVGLSSARRRNNYCLRLESSSFPSPLKGGLCLARNLTFYRMISKNFLFPGFQLHDHHQVVHQRLLSVQGGCRAFHVPLCGDQNLDASRSLTLHLFSLRNQLISTNDQIYDSLRQHFSSELHNVYAYKCRVWHFFQYLLLCCSLNTSVAKYNIHFNIIMKKRELLEPLGLNRTAPRPKLLLRECKTYRRMKRFIYIYSYLYSLMPSYTYTYFKSSIVSCSDPTLSRGMRMQFANSGKDGKQCQWYHLAHTAKPAFYVQLQQLTWMIGHSCSHSARIDEFAVCCAGSKSLCMHTCDTGIHNTNSNVNRLCIHVPLYAHGVTKTTLHFTFPGFLWGWFKQEHMNRMK